MFLFFTKFYFQSRISPTLLPTAAIANVLPQSSQQIKTSRSPSPLAHAIASFTKVGQAIIGDTSPTRNKIKEDKKNTKPRGRSETRKIMMSRPPIALPSEATEDTVYEFDEGVLYATVNKSKPDTKVFI